MNKIIFALLVATTSLPVFAGNSFYFCVANVNINSDEPISYVSNIYSTADFYDKDDRLEKSFGDYVHHEMYGDLSDYSDVNCYPRRTEDASIEAREDVMNDKWVYNLSIRSVSSWSP